MWAESEAVLREHLLPQLRKEQCYHFHLNSRLSVIIHPFWRHVSQQVDRNHHSLFCIYQEQKGNRTWRYEWKLHFTQSLLLGGRRKDVICVWLQNQQPHTQSACPHPGEREVRNKQKSFPVLTCQILLFYSKSKRKQCQKSLRKHKNIGTTLWSWGDTQYIFHRADKRNQHRWQNWLNT